MLDFVLICGVEFGICLKFNNFCWVTYLTQNENNDISSRCKTKVWLWPDWLKGFLRPRLILYICMFEKNWVTYIKLIILYFKCLYTEPEIWNFKNLVLRYSLGFSFTFWRKGSLPPLPLPESGSDIPWKNFLSQIFFFIYHHFSDIFNHLF